MSEHRKHILLVDDEEATLFFHTLMAEEAAVCDSIIGLRSGDDLINKLRQLFTEAGKCSCLIFLDINMPATNGWETLDEIAQLDPSIQPHLHIYMASASEHPADKEKCLRHPLVVDLTPKPVTPEIVKSCFEKMLLKEGAI